jgi:hypothetical protein
MIHLWNGYIDIRIIIGIIGVVPGLSIVIGMFIVDVMDVISTREYK